VKKALHITLLSLVLLGVLILFSFPGGTPAQAYEIRDLSWIQIPDLHSPDLFPIEETIQEIMIRTQNEVTGDTPKNPQCLLLRWSDYIRCFDPGMLSPPDRRPDDLIYLVTVNVTRRPWEAHTRSLGGLIYEEIAKEDPEWIEHFTTHQNIYIFDAGTGETLGFGYTPYVMLLPKQD